MKTKQELYAARPTSPHLSIYRYQISSVLSIFHRMTGMMLFGSLSILAWWMIFWIWGGFDHNCICCFICVLKYLLYAISFSVFYHTCNGIRHLIWDAGYGYSLPVMNATGWLVVVISFAATVVFWMWI